MTLYHGSDHIIKAPVYRGSKRTNDYGYGFYTTESEELAKEWACSDGRNGFSNCYEFEPDGLTVLNLNAPEYSILNWLAVLARYRTYWQSGSIAEEAKEYLGFCFGNDLIIEALSGNEAWKAGGADSIKERGCIFSYSVYRR